MNVNNGLNGVLGHFYCIVITNSKATKQSRQKCNNRDCRFPIYIDTRNDIG
ncbi:uncharacterized protein METZ01_LOCUS66817 [marine metagenome]|uniref:Uncharacterized protein n=1 Tax=marine metagenome TaxID=408172 RepID=A0A381TJ15_9ZZZZ